MSSGYRIVVRENDKGGPEKLIVERFAVQTPKDDEILIEIKAIGINFADTYFRSGLYPGATQLGMEGSGIVQSVGSKAASKYNIGDKVCWHSTMGSYSTHLITSFDNPYLIKIPHILFHCFDSSSIYKYAASILSQALTAHYLSHDVYKVSSNDTVLIHAGAGGTGGLLVQVCKKICNAKCIITTVGSKEKKQIALENGADHVILYKEENFYDKVMEITNNKKCNVVFDGVGKATAKQSLKCCAMRAMLVYFGNASGAVDPVDPLAMKYQGSVVMTRPTLTHFCRTPKETQARMDDVFRWIAQKKLKIRIGAEFPLLDTKRAHQALENRKTIGKIVLIPELPNKSKL